LLVSAVAFGQSDTNKPDSVWIGTIAFAAEPFPAQIEVPVMISSDDNIAGWSLGLRPLKESDLSPYTALTPSAFTHASSPFNGTTSPFWTPFTYNAASNTGFFGWADFAATAAASPTGEMGRLVLDVDAGSVTLGDRVVIDTGSVPTGSPVVTYKSGLNTADRPFPWYTDGPGADILLDVKELSLGTLPTSYALQQNVPNPFNPETQIDFAIPKSGHVRLDIYNTLGQKVKTLVDEQLAVGNKRVSWDGHDDRGKAVASGVYFYKLSVNDFTATKKMLLLK